jgi:hypothetical protein
VKRHRGPVKDVGILSSGEGIKKIVFKSNVIRLYFSFIKTPNNNEIKYSVYAKE